MYKKYIHEPPSDTKSRLRVATEKCRSINHINITLTDPGIEPRTSCSAEGATRPTKW